MANPNIAAISELHVGTLGFNLKTNGVTLLNTRKLDGSTTTSWDHPIATSIFGYTATNTLMMVGQSFDNGRTTTSMTYDSAAMTKIYGSESATTQSLQRGSLYYIVNPNVGNNDVAVSMGGSGNFGNVSSFWCNVDQTNPFKTMEGAIYQTTPSEENGGKYPFTQWTGWSSSQLNYKAEGFRAHLWNMMDQQCEPGDIGFFSTHMTPQVVGLIGGPNTHVINRADGSAAHRDSIQHFAITPDGGKNIVVNSRFSNFAGGSVNGDSSGKIYSLVVIQSPRTEDTLFACPADRVLKVNSIMATNPEATGTYVNVSLAGLGAVNDTAGSAAVTPTGNDAAVRLAQGVKVPMGKPIELLPRPIYMVEGDSLTANAKSTGFMPQDNQKGVDIVVSFESMED